MTMIERIKSRAKNKNLNLKSTAINAGLSENAIYKWDKQKPNADALQKVADVLDTTTDFLLGNTDDPNVSTDTSKNKEADLKEIMDEFKIVKFDGKEIPEEDLPVIERIIKGLMDDRN